MRDVHIMRALEGLAWVSFALLLATLGLVILYQIGALPSFRLSPAEEKVTFSSPRAAKRYDSLRASRLPRESSKWNALVDRHDARRIRVQVLATRRRRVIIAYSFLVSAFLIAAVVATIVREIDDIIRTNEASTFVIVRFIGLLIGVAYGWLAIPAVTYWLLAKVQRNRMPLEWRLLKASKSIEWLIHPQQSKKRTSEDPREGSISVPKARMLLTRIEAEVVETLSRRTGALASDETLWQTRIAPRLTLVLESKARLLDKKNDAVGVDAIYAWMDDLVDVLIHHSTSRRTLERTTIAPTLADGSAAKRARTILDLRFWPSSAAMLLLLSSILFSSIAAAAIFAESEAFFSENPRFLDAVGAIAGIALTGLVTYIVSVAVRNRAR